MNTKRARSQSRATSRLANKGITLLQQANLQVPKMNVRPVSAGTEAVRKSQLGFLRDGVQSFMESATLSEIMFLADALFAWAASYHEERKDQSRCFIADLLLAQLQPHEGE